MNEPQKTKRTWADYSWPDWVPQKVRDEIERFWGPGNGRGTDDWLRATNDPYTGCDGVDFGEKVTLRQMGVGYATGRYVYAWGNLGRLIDDDGTVWYVTNGRVPMFKCWDERWSTEEHAETIYQDDADAAAEHYASTREDVEPNDPPFVVHVVDVKGVRRLFHVDVEYEPVYDTVEIVDEAAEILGGSS